MVHHDTGEAFVVFVDTLQDLRRKLVGDLEPVGSRGGHTDAVR
jgi:hypothetical protein